MLNKTPQIFYIYSCSETKKKEMEDVLYHRYPSILLRCPFFMWLNTLTMLLFGLSLIFCLKHKIYEIIATFHYNMY